MVNWIGLAFPFLYLGLLYGALSTFSTLYRARKLHRARSLAPWFSSNPARDVYFSLLHQEDESEKVPDSLLKAALLRRAQADVQRVLEIRNTKPALAQLLQRGSVGDDLWQRFLRAEQEMEEEIRDVISEANEYHENWGQFIFQSGNEMAQNFVIRQRIEEIQSTVEEEKEWWANRRSGIQSEFMKELDQESAALNGKKGSDDEGVLVEAGGPTANGQASKKKVGKK